LVDGDESSDIDTASFRQQATIIISLISLNLNLNRRNEIDEMQNVPTI